MQEEDELKAVSAVLTALLKITTKHGGTQRNSTARNTATGRNATQRNTAQHNTTQPGTARNDTTPRNTTQHHAAKHSKNTTQRSATRNNEIKHDSTASRTAPRQFYCPGFLASSRAKPPCLLQLALHVHAPAWPSKSLVCPSSDAPRAALAETCSPQIEIQIASQCHRLPARPAYPSKPTVSPASFC